MYGLVERMDPDLAYQLAHRCYWEMVQAGIRTVGEFHYLRHEVLGDSDFALDEAVIQAAHDAGIELVLLPGFVTINVATDEVTILNLLQNSKW